MIIDLFLMNENKLSRPNEVDLTFLKAFGLEGRLDLLTQAYPREPYRASTSSDKRIPQKRHVRFGPVAMSHLSPIDTTCHPQTLGLATQRALYLMILCSVSQF